MQKDFELQNLKIKDENNKESYINLIELNHVNEKDKKNRKNVTLYYLICFSIGLLLFILVLSMLLDKNSYLVNKIAKNEKVRKYFLSKMSNDSQLNMTDSLQTEQVVDQTKQDINKIKEDLDRTKEESRQTKDDLNKIKDDFNKEKEDSKHTKEDLDKLKEDLNKAKEEANNAKEEVNKSKDDMNKLKEDLNKTKEELIKIKEDLGKEGFNKDKVDQDKNKEDLDRNKEEFYKRREDENRKEEGDRRENDNDKNREEFYKRREELDKNKEEFYNGIKNDTKKEGNKTKEELDKNREEFYQRKEDDKNKEDNQEKAKFLTPDVYGEKKLEISFDYKEAIKAQLDKKLDYSKINSFPKEKQKFALCTIGKLENLYARDFVLYYLELGVDKIYIYDNNDINGEKFEDVLQDLIDNKLVKIIDMRGKQDGNPQKIAYEKCYNDYYDIFDWFLFFDFDEYLHIQENTLDNFVKLPLYKDCSSILLYWRVYTDNDQLNYSTESPIKRFTEPINKFFQKSSYFCDKKPILKGGMKDFIYDESNHIPLFPNKKEGEFLTCNSEGKDYEKNKNNKDLIVSFENAFVKHFLWRSTEEYCLKLGIRKFFNYLKYEKKDYEYFIRKYLMYSGGMSKDSKKEKLNKCVE